MNYGNWIRSKNNEELAKWLACETCEYSDECNEYDINLNANQCSRKYNSYKEFLDREVIE
jgi:hypothetical protein